jgi:hypothetical protein
MIQSVQKVTAEDEQADDHHRDRRRRSMRHHAPNPKEQPLRVLQTAQMCPETAGLKWGGLRNQVRDINGLAQNPIGYRYTIPQETICYKIQRVMREPCGGVTACKSLVRVVLPAPLASWQAPTAARGRRASADAQTEPVGFRGPARSRHALSCQLGALATGRAACPSHFAM